MGIHPLNATIVVTALKQLWVLYSRFIKKHTYIEGKHWIYIGISEWML